MDLLNPLEFRKTFCVAWTVLLTGETKSSNLAASTCEAVSARQFRDSRRKAPLFAAGRPV